MASNLIGGLDPGSALNVGGSSKATQKGAGSGESNVKTYALSIATGYVPPPLVPDQTTQTADFYRFGNDTGDAFTSVMARQINQFDDDRQTASIRVRTVALKTEDEKDLIPAYTKFFLESVSEQHMERSQIVETFGDFSVFFYGERPPVYNFSGVLINAKNVNWVQDFMFMYENFLRGTRCVEAGARAILTYGGRQIEGFILGVSNQTTAGTDGGVPMSFQVLVTSRKYLGFSDDFAFATGAGGGTLTLDKDFQKLLDTIAGVAGKDSSTAAASDAIGAAKGVMGGKPAAGVSP
jgi:hypothetical protein